jgi:hypothetical protein
VVRSVDGGDLHLSAGRRRRRTEPLGVVDRSVLADGGVGVALDWSDP